MRGVSRRERAQIQAGVVSAVIACGNPTKIQGGRKGEKAPLEIRTIAGIIRASGWRAVAATWCFGI